MVIATITKNGMINLPAEIRNKFNLSPGDRIKFVEFEDGVMIIPIKELHHLIDSSGLDKAIEIVKEVREERNLEVSRRQ